MKLLWKFFHQPQARGSIVFLAAALVLFVSGFYLLVPWTARAAVLDKVKATITDSRAGTSIEGNWTIQFVTATGAAESTDTITLTIDPSGQAFNLTGIVEDDIDLEVDNDANCDGAWTDRATASSAASDVWGVNINTSTDVITLTHPTNNGSTEGIPTNRCVRVLVGSHADGSGTGANKINNPNKVGGTPGTADIYSVDIAGDFGDTGTALVAIVEGVTVSVTIDESLSVVLAEVAAASCPSSLPGTDKSDDSGHTDTAITFGTLSAGNAFNHSCHQLTIGTNASDGYTTTAYKTQLLTAGTDTIADGDCNGGTCTTTQSGVWTTTSENGFAYCMDDVTGDAAATADGTEWTAVQQCDDSTPEFKLFGTGDGNTQPIMASGGAVSGDNSIIAVVLNYPQSQPAGTYQTTLVFVTTPQF